MTFRQLLEVLFRKEVRVKRLVDGERVISHNDLVEEVKTHLDIMQTMDDLEATEYVLEAINNLSEFTNVTDLLNYQTIMLSVSASVFNQTKLLIKLERGVADEKKKLQS